MRALKPDLNFGKVLTPEVILLIMIVSFGPAYLLGSDNVLRTFFLTAVVSTAVMFFTSFLPTETTA